MSPDLVQIGLVFDENGHADRRMDRNDGPVMRFLSTYMQLCKKRIKKHERHKMPREFAAWKERRGGMGRYLCG